MKAGLTLIDKGDIGYPELKHLKKTIVTEKKVSTVGRLQLLL